MIDPQAAQRLLAQLTAGATVDNDDLKDRARQGKLTLRAMIKAQGSGCECEPCQILREGLAIMMGEDKVEGTPHAPSQYRPA